ncbi:MAG: glucosamine-6-phosphate deaminase [Acidobacteriota bacterium]|nr:glucosamine-6-phosphate deaminase [Acidobacteriota bacterium]
MVRILQTSDELAQSAAHHAAESLRALLERQGSVRLLAATGASQLAFLDALTASRDLDWQRVELFHLDEYVGLGVDHPASFARYIKEKIVDRTGIVRYHLLDGERDPHASVTETGREIVSKPVDLALVGIGENGHLAFNDPPADFETEDPYLIVELDELCRHQQVGEGWFASIEDVPKRAITISVKQLMQAREIVCIVPDRRKAMAVRACLDGPVSPLAPASLLRLHPNTTIYLDRHSSALLSNLASKPPSR